MNEFSDQPFEEFIERIVAPVKASRVHKRRMREELLVHLSEAFAEERASTDNDDDACRATLARFGTPEEVTRDLQSSVPASDRLQAGREIAVTATLSVVYSFVVHNAVLIALLQTELALRDHYALSVPHLIRALFWDGFWVGAIAARTKCVYRPYVTAPAGVVLNLALMRVLTYRIAGTLPTDYFLEVVQLAIVVLITCLGAWLFRRPASRETRVETSAA